MNMVYKIRAKYLSVLLLFFCSLLFSCQPKMTPMQVSEQFWQGIITNDITKVKKYSLRDSFNDEETSLKIDNISFGKIIIDADITEIETIVMLHSERGKIEIPLMTILELEDGLWRVDHKSTIPPLLVKQDVTELMDGIQELTEDFSKEIESSVEEFKEKAIPEIKSKLEQAEKEIREKLPELKSILDEFLQDLEESIEKSMPPPQEEVETQET